MTNPHEARVLARDLPISTKQTIEICNFIRGKPLDRAKAELGKVVRKEMAIPFRRFKDSLGHKASIGPGRYPVKASRIILKVLNSLEANAQNKGLDTGSLHLKTVIPNKAHLPWHFGRQRRRAKRTHVEIIAEEAEEKGKKAEKKKKAQDKK